MSICFKCEKKEVCLVKGIKEHCNEFGSVGENMVGNSPMTVIHGGRSAGKTFKKLIKMLEESHANADRIIKLCDEMELQQDKLLIENEELKSLLSTNLSWIDLKHVKDLPKGEVIALNYEAHTYGFKEVLIGMLHYNSDKSYVSCESENESLMNVTHYMTISFPSARDGE